MRVSKPLIAALWITAGTITLVPAVGHAQGEHARRVAAELLVLRGDLRRLSDDDFSSQQKIGLSDRIRGSLAGLDLLLRFADQEGGRTPQPQTHGEKVDALRRSFDIGSLRDHDNDLDRLIAAFPLKTAILTPSKATAGQLSSARKLHDELCAGCHDQPDLEVERPAYNLFGEARRLSPAEFTARMLVGVRGDRITGIDNPLTDPQIGNLFAFYRAGN